MPFTKKEHKKFNKKSNNSFILGGDIGGTNTNLGLFGIKNNFPTLLLSLHFKTKELRGLRFAVNEALSYIQKNHKVTVRNACLAAAGVLSPKRDYVKTQNLPWDIDKKELLRKTKLKKILLVNDFEAIGYGIGMLNKNDVAVIKKAQKVPKAPIVVIGAGTGLGKTTLIYNEHCKGHTPLPSEAGHSDFAARIDFGLDLIDFIKKNKNIKQSVSYEMVLSGQGLSNIYLFLRKSERFRKTKYTNEIDNSKNKHELISKYRHADNTCRAVWKIFKKAYATFARNCALDSISFGGVYIGGGIAPKNRDIFDRDFVKSFEDNYKMKSVLKKIPIYLILNYNVGLLGAGVAACRFLRK